MNGHRKYFVTYSDGEWRAAGRRIAREAEATGEFDGVYAFGRDDVSPLVRNCPAFAVPRGAGLWCWKPDIMLKVLDGMADGDALVYCDAGCSLFPGRGWKRLWRELVHHDLIAQRIYQRNDRWMRAELLEEFRDVAGLARLHQFMATVVIVVKSDFTRRFLSEWRRYMTGRLDLFADVTPAERPRQPARLIESRHDQSVFTALVYRCLSCAETRRRILARWEHVEDRDALFPQIIRATRWRGEEACPRGRGGSALRRFAKDFLYKPFVAAPLQAWHERRGLTRATQMNTTKPMVYDCFPFNNELDILEIRLNELRDVADRFVLVEATHTHNGDPKPLVFAANKARFAPFLDRIIHIVVDDFSAAEGGAINFDERAWRRENIQRNAIARGLVDAGDGDLVIVSDLDEIPRASAVARAVQTHRRGEVVGFALAHYNYFLNLRNASVPVWVNDPKMVDVAAFRNEAIYAAVPYAFCVLEAVNPGATATRFRFVKPTRRVRNGGWHFSYMGGVAGVVRKVRAFNEHHLGRMSDAALEEHVRTRLETGRALAGFDRFLPEPLDATFPAYVLANRERLAPFIMPVATGRAKRLLRYAWFRSIGGVRNFCNLHVYGLLPKWTQRLIARLFGMAG